MCVYICMCGLTYELSLWNRVHIDKLVVALLSKERLPFTEPKGSLVTSGAIGPCLEPAASHP
jgi:hypothetical protein